MEDEQYPVKDAEYKSAMLNLSIQALSEIKALTHAIAILQSGEDSAQLKALLKTIETQATKYRRALIEQIYEYCGDLPPGLLEQPLY